VVEAAVPKPKESFKVLSQQATDPDFLA